MSRLYDSVFLYCLHLFSIKKMSCCIWTLISLFGVVIIAFIFTICVLVKMLTFPFPQLTRTRNEEKFYDYGSECFRDFPSIEEEPTVHLSVVVPAYNEEARLPPMLDECTEYLEERIRERPGFKYEIIVVSDGSQDGTCDVAVKYCRKLGPEKVRLLKLQTNRGKGGAVNLGVRCCRGAVILFADADGATKFADLSKLESALEALTKKDYVGRPDEVAIEEAIICGSRAHLEHDAIATRSAFRNLLMHGFHFLVWLLAVRSLRDTQCGFKLLTRTAARRCFRSLHVNRWAFDVELLYIAERLNVKLVEVAVRWTEIDGSKLVPFWSWLQMGFDLVMIWLRYTVGAWKLVPVS